VTAVADGMAPHHTAIVAIATWTARRFRFRATRTIDLRPWL